MATVKIIYSDVEKSAKDSKDASKRLKSYKSHLESMVGRTLRSLPGSDSSGYVSSALGKLNKKMNRIDKSAVAFSKGEKMIKSIEQKAKSTDKKVASSISSLAEPYVQELGFFQKVGNLFYEMFCVEGGARLSEKKFGKAVVSIIRHGKNEAEHGIKEARTWFKYKEGQYTAKQIKAVMKVVGTALKVIGFVGLATLASPWAVVAGLIAGGIYLSFTMIDAAATIDETRKAQRLELESQEKKGLARYYGNTNGVRDYIEKKDFGGEKANRIMEYIGTSYEFTEKANKLIFGICNAYLSLTAISPKTMEKYQENEIENMNVRERWELSYKDRTLATYKKIYKYEDVNTTDLSSPHSVGWRVIFGNPKEKIGKLFEVEKGFPLTLINAEGKIFEGVFLDDEDAKVIKEYIEEPKWKNLPDYTKAIVSKMGVVKGLKVVYDDTPFDEFFDTMGNVIGVTEVFSSDNDNIYENMKSHNGGGTSAFGNGKGNGGGTR